MVHQYKNNGYNIVLDVQSGAIHVVDDITYDLISLFEDKTREEAVKEVSSKYKSVSAVKDIEEAYDEIQSLVDEKVLFSPDIYEERIEEFSKNRPVVVKALCLHIAHDCNLACRYCFADEGTYNGQKRELMPYEVGKRALDFLIENSGNRHNLEVDFFGGEPTLNWKVVEDLVKYGRSREEETGKKFRFTVTTNGMLLNDEMMDFCNREMHNVVLSVDGRKEIHDMMRPSRGGQPTYDIIMPKFKKFAESRHQEKYYVRGTFTRNNLDFSKDVISLANEGFKQISMEPVVAPPEADYAIREEDVPVIKEQYDILAKEMLRRYKTSEDFNFFHFMIDLEGGPCVYKRLSGCGSGTEYLAVTPRGDLYPCHQFVGNEKFKMGDIWKGVQNIAIRDKFKCANVYAKPECRNCFARFYCSGGCQANAYNFSGDILGNYPIGCELQRKRIECAIMLKAAEAEIDEAHK